MPAIERQRVRDHVFGSDLVINVAREVVAGVLAAAFDVLIGVIQRRTAGIETQTIVDADDTAVVSVEAVGSEQRHRTFLVAEVRAAVETPEVGEARVETPTETEIGVRLEHDVDDACHSLGIVFGRWVWNHFDPLDDVRGDLFEIRGELSAGDWSRTAIDLNRHVFVAAKTDFAFAIDLYGRSRLKHVTRICCRWRDVFRTISVAIGLDDHGRTLTSHLHALQSHGNAGELDGADVSSGRSRSDRKLRSVGRREADARNPQVVGARSKPLDSEGAVVGALRAGDELGIGFGTKRYDWPRDGSAAVGGNDWT